MQAKCKVCKNGACSVQVIGLERDSNQYLDGEQVSFRNYTFEQTVTLNSVTSLNSKEEETREQYSLVPHFDIDIDEIEIKTDGLKQIDHFIIPTKEWLDYVLEREVTALDSYSIVYYFDNDKFYKYVAGREIEVGVDEILEVNHESTTVIKESVHIFQLCHLEECFFKLCMYLLDNIPCTDPCITDKVKGFKLDILNRDIVWMAINAIKYCIEQQQFFRAQKLLEHIETCWGICKDTNNINKSNYKGCGCSA